METKNVIAAIALSSAVIVLYSLFFIPEKPTENKNSFKVVDDKKKVPKFKPTEKKKKNVFKVVD